MLTRQYSRVSLATVPATPCCERELHGELRPCSTFHVPLRFLEADPEHIRYSLSSSSNISGSNPRHVLRFSLPLGATFDLIITCFNQLNTSRIEASIGARADQWFPITVVAGNTPDCGCSAMGTRRGRSRGDCSRGPALSDRKGQQVTSSVGH